MSAMPAPVRILVFGFGPIAAIIAVFVGAIAYMAHNQEEPEQSEERGGGVAVFAVEATRQDVPLTVRTQGEARPRTEIDLVPQVSGAIVYVSDNFREGGFFSEDQPLVRIDATDYRLAVTQAEAAVAAAARALELEQGQSEIARREWERFKQGEPSDLALRKPQLAAARADLASAKAALESAQLQLARTTLSAPFAGRVRTKAADVGQYVTPGQSLGRVFADDVVQVRLPLTDEELALLGLPVAFSADASNAAGPMVTLRATVGGAQQEWAARLARTDSVIDAMTRTVFAIVEVDDPYGAGVSADGAPLPIGLFVEAEMVGRTVSNAFVLPRAALRRTNDIYVANRDGTLSIRQATVVTSNRTEVVLSGGLAEGEFVITSPVLSPSEGMRVDVYDADGVLLFPQPAPDAETDGEAIAEAPQDGDRS